MGGVLGSSSCSRWDWWLIRVLIRSSVEGVLLNLINLEDSIMAYCATGEVGDKETRDIRLLVCDRGKSWFIILSMGYHFSWLYHCLSSSRSCS